MRAGGTVKTKRGKMSVLAQLVKNYNVALNQFAGDREVAEYYGHFLRRLIERYENLSG